MVVKIRNRKQDVIDLENHHCDLYYADKRVLIWTSLTQTCDKLLNIKSTEELTNILHHREGKLPEQSIINYFDSTLDNFKTIPLPLAESLQKSRFSDKMQTTQKDSIASGYPYDGQRNFHPKEFLSQLGFVVMNAYSYYEFDSMKIKWSHKEDGTIYTNCSYSPFNQVMYFHLPLEFLKKENIYKMEVVGFSGIEKSYDLGHFEKYFSPVSRQVYTDLNGGSSIQTIYFRVSKYDSSYDKTKQIPQELHCDPSHKVTLKMDEGLSASEVGPEGDYTFTAQFDNSYKEFEKIHSNPFMYYMDVPHTEKENSHLEGIANHTLSESFLFCTNDRIIKNYVCSSCDENFNSKNGYTSYDIPEEVFELSLSDTLPIITAEDYMKVKTPSQPSTLVIDLNTYVKSSEKRLLQAQEAIAQRIQQRAKYFHNIDQEAGTAQESKGLQYYLDREEEKLHPLIKEHLEMKFDKKTSGKLQLSHHLHYSDLSTLSSSHKIIIN